MLRNHVEDDVASASALAPDFKTIADFRRDNGTAIVGTCRAFVLFSAGIQSLFTARLVALDGSKFRCRSQHQAGYGPTREIAEEGRSSRPAGSPNIWPVWMRATPANLMKHLTLRRHRFKSSNHDALN